MQYAKKAGHHVGTKYTMGIGGEMDKAKGTGKVVFLLSPWLLVALKKQSKTVSISEILHII